MKEPTRIVKTTYPDGSVMYYPQFKHKEAGWCKLTTGVFYRTIQTGNIEDSQRAIDIHHAKVDPAIEYVEYP